jgi:predicted 2-oxoglutarate/Fe(II)-dependent dioxygenase YbiX
LCDRGSYLGSPIPYLAKVKVHGTQSKGFKPENRIAEVLAFWIQSRIRTESDRTLLYDLDTAIQRLAKESPGNPIGVQLTGVYDNLLRRGRRYSEF